MRGGRPAAGSSRPGSGSPVSSSRSSRGALPARPAASRRRTPAARSTSSSRGARPSASGRLPGRRARTSSATAAANRRCTSDCGSLKTRAPDASVTSRLVTGSAVAPSAAGGTARIGSQTGRRPSSAAGVTNERSTSTTTSVSTTRTRFSSSCSLVRRSHSSLLSRNSNWRPKPASRSTLKSPMRNSSTVTSSTHCRSRRAVAPACRVSARSSTAAGCAPVVATARSATGRPVRVVDPVPDPCSAGHRTFGRTRTRPIGRSSPPVGRMSADLWTSVQSRYTL